MYFDVIIIGAGTAGMSAAIYVQRAGKSALVLEGKVCGGQIINSPDVENYPGIQNISGADFAVSLYQQVVKRGAEIKFESAIQIAKQDSLFSVSTAQNEYTCRAVIIATGAINRPLGLPGEQELTGKGISYCATCDGAFFKGKTVAVAGGGNTALEDALFLTEYCKKVFIIHRRDTFRGEEALSSALKQRTNAQILFDTVIQGISGGNRLEKITVKNIKSNTETQLAVEGLFIAIGQIPQNENFSQIVRLDASGYIIAGEDCKTTAEGIFAAGDCRTKSVRQLSTASADGTVAALGACEYIMLHK